MDPVTIAYTMRKVRQFWAHRRHDILKRPLISGHRGTMTQAPENTISALQFCVHHGIPSVEIDVRTTADGAFVIMHDATVDRTTNGTGEVASMTLAEIRTLDAGSWFDSAYFAGERVPTLEEVLEWSRGKFQRIYLEIKAVNDPSALYQVVANAGMLDTVLFHAFPAQFWVLEAIRAIDRDAQLSVIMDSSFDEALSWAKAHNAIAIDLYWPTLKENPNWVKAAHDAGLWVDLWRISHTHDMLAAIQMGVDGLMLDSPTCGQFLLKGAIL